MRILLWTCCLLPLSYAIPQHAQAQCGATPQTTRGGIILTFDDHSIDSWYAARALFNELEVRATFFVDRFHTLTPAQKQKLRDLASDGHEVAAHTYSHGNARNFSTSAYMSQQIVPQLSAMASEGFYPRNFAYPYGADVAPTTSALYSEFGFVRDTSYYPNHGASFVTCDDADRFVAGLGIDYQYGQPNSVYFEAFDQAMCEDSNLILYGHHLSQSAAGGSQYYIDLTRLRTLLEAAQARGLRFNRMQDICRWQTALSGTGTWTAAHDSPRRFDEVTFADFDGDGDDDAFRSTGTEWRWLENQGGYFYTGTNQEHWAYLNTSSIPYGNLAFGDFDGDGRTDVFRASGGRWYVSYAGTSAWTQINSSNYGFHQLRYGDFDGDGRTDVFLTSGGRWYVSYGGTGRWQWVQSSGYPLERLRFADFDGDGRTDVFVSSGGRWYVSDGARGSWRSINVSGVGVDDLGFADFNGDGRTDVIRATGSRWYVSWSGTSAWSLLRYAPERLSDVVFADINGDGRADAVRVAGD